MSRGVRFRIAWSAPERGLELDLRLLQPGHPSESPARRCLRTLAWGLFHRDGIRFNADSICRPGLPDLEAPGGPERPPLAVAVGTVTVRRLRALPGPAELAVLLPEPAAAERLRTALPAGLADRTRLRWLAPGLPPEWAREAPEGDWRAVETAGRLYLFAGEDGWELDVAGD